MRIFQDKKIVFKISNYGKISRNVTALEKMLLKLNITYITERVTTWQDCARIERFDRP